MFLPWNAISKSFIVGFGVFLKRVYIDITIPGVQKPHWEPCALAIRSWTGCNFVLMLPIPSTVVTAKPCTAHIGNKHAFTAKWLLIYIKIKKIIFSF